MNDSLIGGPLLLALWCTHFLLSPLRRLPPLGHFQYSGGTPWNVGIGSRTSFIKERTVGVTLGAKGGDISFTLDNRDGTKVAQSWRYKYKKVRGNFAIQNLLFIHK
jgi:hypothetical protein